MGRERRLQRHGIRWGTAGLIDIILGDHGVRGEDDRKDSMKGTEIERVTGSCNHVR
jgi:hypothetical protein